MQVGGRSIRGQVAQVKRAICSWLLYDRDRLGDRQLCLVVRQALRLLHWRYVWWQVMRLVGETTLAHESSRVGQQLEWILISLLG